MSPSRYITAELRRMVLKCQNGIISIEFAMILPVLLILTIPTVNFFYYILAIQKVHKVSSALADMVSLSVPVSATTKEAEVNNSSTYLTSDRLIKMVGISDQVMMPLKMANGSGTVTITSIHQPADKTKKPIIAWQYFQTPSGSGFTKPKDVLGSPLGNTGEVPNLPSSFSNAMYSDEGLVAVEVSYTYNPPINLGLDTQFPAVDSTPIYSIEYYPARFGALQYIVPDVSPPGWPPPP